MNFEDLAWKKKAKNLHHISFFFRMDHFILFYGHLACGILVPRPGIKPVSPVLEVRNCNHWTAREVPPSYLDWLNVAMKIFWIGWNKIYHYNEFHLCLFMLVNVAARKHSITWGSHCTSMGSAALCWSNLQPSKLFQQIFWALQPMWSLLHLLNSAAVAWKLPQAAREQTNVAVFQQNFFL